MRKNARERGRFECAKGEKRQRVGRGGRVVYFSFFLGRSWLLWPHFLLRQLVARGGRRACYIGKKERVSLTERRSVAFMGKKKGKVCFCTYVALAADGLLAVVLGGESLQRGLNDTTTETEDKVKSGFLYEQNKQTVSIEIHTKVDALASFPS